MRKTSAGKQHSFSNIPKADVRRSVFNRSSTHKTTFNEGLLIPVFVDEVLPGDTHIVNMTAICRLATPIFPIFDNLYFDTHFFFIPCRLVWSHWVNFQGEQANPGDTTDYVLPTVTTPGGGVVVQTLYDYLGIPLGVAGLVINNLPARCYAKIYNDWYRDENLQNSVTLDMGDGPDTYANYVINSRGKRYDYFTSCLPWPQKINDGTVVEIPLGSTAPIIPATSSSYPSFYTTSDATPHAFKVGALATVTGNPLFGSVFNSSSTGDVIYWSNAAGGTGLVANLSSATSATINQLRQSFQLQVLFERDARGGTRYTELLKSHWNVTSPDFRLQRSEFLGGGTQMITVNPVAQSSVTAATPQGNLAAFGVGHVQGHSFTKSFTEHGYVIGIASVRADLNYQYGIERMFQRSTRYDFLIPALCHIGEQAVLNQEIYATATGTDAQVFGYQERYAEYRFKISKISGFFRSSSGTPLDAWHLAQKFTSLPTLGSTFIVEKAPMSRIEAVSNNSDFICDMFFSQKSVRIMPLYGDPMPLGRF